MRLFFARLDEKHNLLEIFEKIFKGFHKNIAKNAWLLHIFQKNLTNNALLFRAFGRKTRIAGNFWENFENFWWKFYRKLNFYFIFIFRKCVTKNRALGNNTIFLQHFFRLGCDFPLFAAGYGLGKKINPYA